MKYGGCFSRSCCLMGLPGLGKIVLILVAPLLLPAMLFLMPASDVFAAIITISGNVTADSSSPTSINIAMPYSSDDNASSTYTVEYKQCADTLWTTHVANAPHAASPFMTTIPGQTTDQCYDIRATYIDADGTGGRNPQLVRITAGWDSTMLHNSNRFPDTTKWSGSWGMPAGQYGQIVCETCHTKNAPNIKRIRGSITAPDSPVSSFPGQTGGTTVNFQSSTSPNGFGDDSIPHVTSQKICEHCHSITSYHRYDTAGQSSLDHNNNSDCMVCHPHSLGFKDATACDSCHGAPPGTGTDSNAPANYAASHATHYDPLGGLPSSYTATSNRSTASYYVFDCGFCHSNNNADHLANQDGTVDVKLPAGGTFTPGSYSGGDNLTPPGSVTFKNSSGTCSNTYCHGNYPGSGKNATPTWGNTTSGACGTCHAASNNADATSKTGGHEKHADTDQTINGSPEAAYNRGYACTLCHNEIAGGTAPSSYTVNDASRHANGKVDWAFDTADPKLIGSPSYSIPTGSAAPSNGTTPRPYGTCANIYCHSIVQTGSGGALTPNSADYSEVTWGGTVYCGACHKQDGSHYVGDIMDSGSHTKHLSYDFTAVSRYKKCEVCHRYGTSDIKTDECGSCHIESEKTLHANGAVNVIFYTPFTGANGTYSGTAQPGDGFGACTNTYCHSAGTSVATNVIPDNTTTNWGTGLLACDSCHTGGTTTGPTYSTGDPKANSHSKHVVGNSYKCVDCHSAVVNASKAIIDKAKHVNKAYDVAGASITSYTYAADGGTCSTQCHGAETPKWGSVVACGSCHAANNTLAGSHAKHYQTATTAADRSAVNNSTVAEYRFNCGVCHFNAPHAKGPENNNRTAQVVFDSSIGNGTFTEGGVSQTDPVTSFKYTNSTCSTSYCHGNYPGSGKNATPTWGTASSGACGTCHEASNTTPPASGTHSKHASNTSGNNNNPCSLCHYSIVGGSGPNSYTITDNSKHVSGYIDWVFDTSDPRVSSSSYSIGTGSSVPSDGTTPRAYGTCSQVYCHSYAQKDGGLPLPPAQMSRKPEWGGGVGCGSCHSVPPFSGSHRTAPHNESHENFMCSNSCHIGGGYTGGYNSPNHANYNIEVGFATIYGGASATYSQNPNFPGNGYGYCSNTYCHSNGTSVSTGTIPNNTTPDWGSAGSTQCNSCHGNPPAYDSGSPKVNTHLKHTDYSCNKCHVNTTSDGTTIISTWGNHVNNTYNVDAGAGVSFDYAFNASGGTCSSISCHFNNTAVWGGGSLGCTGCHGFAPNTGAHATHIQNSGLLTQVYGSTEVVSDAANYAFGCGNCHPVDSAHHGNGTIELSLNPADGGTLKSRNSGPTISGSGNTTQCNGVYCHSNGMMPPTFAQTPQWGSAYTVGACNGCHGNSPNSAGHPTGSAAHGSHVVGIHYNTIYTGTIGLSAAGTDISSSHGNAASSMTINCNICHYSTVASSANDLNAICTNCHNGAQATLRGNAAIADKSLHVNSVPDVVFEGVQGKSRAQLRDNVTNVAELDNNWSRPAGSYKSGATPYDTAKNAFNAATMWTAGTKTCSNIACHNGNSVAWTDTVSCRSCHTQLPQ